MVNMGIIYTATNSLQNLGFQNGVWSSTESMDNVNLAGYLAIEYVLYPSLEHVRWFGLSLFCQKTH